MTAGAFKVELFLIMVNDFQRLTIITKSSTLDVVAVLDLPLVRATGTIKDTYSVSSNLRLDHVVIISRSRDFKQGS